MNEREKVVVGCLCFIEVCLKSCSSFPLSHDLVSPQDACYFCVFTVLETCQMVLVADIERGSSIANQVELCVHERILFYFMPFILSFLQGTWDYVVYMTLCYYSFTIRLLPHY